MKRLIASFVIVVLAGCAGASPSLQPGASASPVLSPPGSGSPSAAASASASAGAGLTGEPLATVEAELAAMGFSFVDQSFAQGIAGRLGTTADGVGQVVLVGDPLVAFMIRVRDPFLDFGPLHTILRTRGRDDVVAWKDEHMALLTGAGAAHQATATFGGDTVVFTGSVGADGTTEAAFMLGDLAALGIPLPSPGASGSSASPEPSSDMLRDAMMGYEALARMTNAELTLSLVVLLDETEALASRVAAAARIEAAETALDGGLAAITWPPAVEPAVTTLTGLAQATVRAVQPVTDAATREELAAAIPALVEALRAEGTAASDVRSALLSFGTMYGIFASTPPPVDAGAEIPAPGALTSSGHSLSLENGDGSLDVFVEDQTGAFALGVTITVDIYAYEGPLVDTRTLRLEVVAPGATETATEEIVDMRPPGLTPQRAEVTSIEVETWRAAGDLSLLGR